MTTTPIIQISTARPVEDYRLHLVFDDGREQIVDFLPFLSRSVHPAIRKWLDPVRFASFRIEQGELIWGDYDLCFPMIDLYRNTIDHRRPLEMAA